MNTRRPPVCKRSSGRTRTRRRKLVKEYYELPAQCSLSALIEALQSFRASIPENDDAEVILVGDDDFGRRLSITYLRELTAQEAALEKRYAAPAAAIPTPTIKLRNVRYDEHAPLLWGGDLHAQQPPGYFSCTHKHWRSLASCAAEAAIGGRANSYLTMARR
jgi:hypothetical protein